MHFTDNDKRRIKDASDDKLYEVICDFITLDQRQSGQTFTGKCPICGEPKGFELHKGKGAYKCFKCNNISGKSVMTFLMKGLNKSFPEALFVIPFIIT